MPRRRRAEAAPAAQATAPPPPLVPVVEPNAVFTAATFRAAFGLRTSTLAAEVRARRLRVHKRAGRYFILGSDVLAWLRGGEVRPKVDSASP